MKILWVCNIMLPAAAKALREPYSVREGWLTGILDRVLTRKTGLELGLCFPVKEELGNFSKELMLKPQNDSELPGRKVHCFGFVEDLTKPEEYDVSLELRFGQILKEFSPDLVHIFGTEFPHALACAKAWNRPEKTLVGIQGICGSIAEYYMADLPKEVVQARTFRDILKRDSLLEQQQKFKMRAISEKKLLELTENVTGRTAFDRQETAKINPDVNYHFLNETMRGSFYKDSWNYDKCRKYQLFVSQADYPLKGFHYVLQAMQEILQQYPDTTLIVAGNSVLGVNGIWNKMKIPAYGKYLRKLMDEGELWDKVKILGPLSEEKMKEAYLSSHVFICSSAVENSPNSLAEAQLLGVPSVASNAGGIPTVANNGEAALLFEKGDVHGIADAVCRIFESEEFARELSGKERQWAKKSYDGETNYLRLLEIYQDICKEKA